MKYKISDFLTRARDTVDIEDDQEYKRVTIRINHMGVCLRDIERGVNIGTKKQYLVKEGQFILSGIDARNAAFGIVPEELTGAVVTNDFWTFNINPDLVDTHYFYYLTKTPDFLDACKRSSLGTTNRQRLQKDVFFNQTFEIPPIDDQKRKIRFIQKITKKIIECESLIAELPIQQAKLKQSILQDAIQGKLVPQDPSDEPAEKLLEEIKVEKEKLVKERKLRKEKSPLPISQYEISYDLPTRWVWCRLGKVATFLNGYAFKSEWFNCEGAYRLVRNINIGHDTLTWKDIEKISNEIASKFSNFKLAEDDILISLDRPLISTGLKVARVTKNDLPCLLLQRVAKISTFQNQLINEFLYLWIKSPIFLSSINPGRSNGIPHISTKDLEKIPFSLPPLNEQKRIVEKVDSLMKICDEQEKNIIEAKENIKKLNQAILREMFS